MSSKLQSFPSIEALSNSAADLVIDLANKSIAERGVFRVALAGGSTPRRLHQVLSSEEYRSKTDWSAWMIYFGDERLVDLADDQSNYAMANSSLLTNVPIQDENVFPPPVHLSDGKLVASAYEETLRKTFDDEGGLPHFDLILLGLGSDGHTASLFPGKPALDVQDQLVVDSDPGVLPPPVSRVTFTFPLINASRNVIFLAAGKDKAPAFRAAYEGVPLGDVKQVPANAIQLENGDLYWLITEELLEN